MVERKKDLEEIKQGYCREIDYLGQLVHTNCLFLLWIVVSGVTEAMLEKDLGQCRWSGVTEDHQEKAFGSLQVDVEPTIRSV
jgi:hypothetical protein